MNNEGESATSAGSRSDFLARFFRLQVARPWWVIGLCVLGCLSAAWFLPQLKTDLGPDAFLAPDNPALVYRDIVKEQFGLSDPLVLAVVDRRPGGIYRPQVLQLLQWLTDQISQLPNVPASRVVSLATEKNIISSAEGMEVRPFLEELPASMAASLRLKQAVEQFPLYVGTLVSADGHAALVIAELADEDRAEATYRAVTELLQTAPLPPSVDVHVAGEGAVMGYLASYVDADARRLVPFAGLVIFLVILLAFRQLGPAVVCALITVFTVVITLGTMAAQAVPVYVITNALPVILIGISVADAIHVYSHYFSLQRARPDSPRRDLVVETMLAMSRPLTLTSLTTIAGFLGLYFAGYMPPFKHFGLYAALGVAVAWVYSLTFLPAAIALTRPASRDSQSVGFTAAMTWLGTLTRRHAGAVIGGSVLIALLGLYGASHLTVDDEPIGLFLPDEPLVVADRVINAYAQGSNTLDIVVETPAVDGLLDPRRLRKIEALQTFVSGLPHVGGSVSIVDYLKQINRAVNEGAPAAYTLPDDADLVAQYLLLYSAMSDPTDFEEEIDYDYRMANVRVNIKRGGYQDTRQIIEPLERYLSDTFNGPDIKATLSGRVNLNYRWIKELAVSHFKGVGIALVLVWGVSAILFRSELAGLYTLLPICCTVLGVYAVMAALGITLGMGTSMFAAVSIGLGIDFAIHTLDRLGRLASRLGGDMPEVFREFYPTTGRALLFNFLTIACGFGVLTLSKISSLNNFGSIVVLSIGTSFVTSLMLLPALVLRLRPGFVVAPRSRPSGFAQYRVVTTVVVVALAALLLSRPSRAEEAVDAQRIVEQVNAVEEGQQVTRKLAMTLVDRRGRERHKETVIFRKDFADDTRTVVFYTAPANVRDTAFLIWDYADPDQDDDQWLYLPAMRKVRRISAADRGDYFLGTDFTYDDIKLDGKLEPKDYDFTLIGEQSPGEHHHYRLAGVPKSDAIARELGYSRIEVLVDADNSMIVEVKFWDLKGSELKTLEVADIVRVDGIWTRRQLHITNHQTGHQTRFEFSDVDYRTPVDDNLFTRQALERGYR
ncbi:MAG: outer membrane lipoprotein-sorting protein [Halioglobus sp.]|nr:outer membrane lipoprotein-sorting protein [Halioglobus sp.]